MYAHAHISLTHTHRINLLYNSILTVFVRSLIKPKPGKNFQVTTFRANLVFDIQMECFLQEKYLLAIYVTPIAVWAVWNFLITNWGRAPIFCFVPILLDVSEDGRATILLISTTMIWAPDQWDVYPMTNSKHAFSLAYRNDSKANLMFQAHAIAWY